MKRIVSLLVVLLFVCGAVFSTNSDFTIVIDAGHGGKDPGALRGTIKEKDINLAVAKELGRLIERNMSGVNVIYTRKTDVFVDLRKRSDIANKAKANLFISIHTNSTAAKTTSASGADTYILGLTQSAENLAVAKRENSVIKYEDDYTTKYEGFDPDSPESYIIFEFMTNQYMQQSLDLASYIQKDFKTTAKRVDRGVRQAGFLVLRESSMPSILIELGFINNPVEAKYLSSSSGQNTMAASIYSGVKKYKDDVDKRQGRTPSSANATPQRQQPVESAPEPPRQTAATQRDTTPSRDAASAGDAEYRVQFLYSQHKLSDGSSQFKGIVPTSYTEESGFKYMVGATTSIDEITKMQTEVRRKFPDAFVVKVSASSGVKSTASQPRAEVAQPVVKREEPTPTPVATSNNIPAGTIEYRVQFLYSPTKLADNASQLQGLPNVSYYVDNGYKYTAGSTTDYNEILRIFRDVKKKYSDAFVIRMKNGKRI